MDTQPYRTAVLISGRGSNLRALIDHRATHPAPWEIVTVLSDRADAHGLEYANLASIPTVIVERRSKELALEEFNRQLVCALQAYAPNLIVLAGFMRIVTATFLDSFGGNVINIHPSLLPAFPGADAQRQALEAGVQESGCTTHYVIPAVDAGPIIAQVAVPVVNGDSVDSLSKRILQVEHRLLPATVDAIARGFVRQDGAGGVIFEDSVKESALAPFLRSRRHE